MKPVATLFAALLVCCSPSCAQAISLPAATSAYPADYSELLKTYVTPEGVRYAAWHSNLADVERLKKVVAFFASTAPPADRKAAFAWHLNAYNAWILNNILAKYPTTGPREGGEGFFDHEGIVISGRKTSFNDLEQVVIRPNFQDPRVHFALNCASASCPPLLGKPFEPGTLDEDLDHLARAFINTNPQGVVSKTDKVIRLSKLFDWYADDFGGKGNQAAFINRYREHPLPAGAKFEFMNYNWNLNEAP
jgi:hypothetical protein